MRMKRRNLLKQSERKERLSAVPSSCNGFFRLCHVAGNENRLKRKRSVAESNVDFPDPVFVGGRSSCGPPEIGENPSE
jgi:hypothetical protein